MIGNGSILAMLGGYSPVALLGTGRSMPSIQMIGLDNHVKEHKLLIPETNKRLSHSSSRLASAVTLSTGEVILTGGLGMEREVFLLSGLNLEKIVQKNKMSAGRLGHASVATRLGGEESVLVAGGWDSEGIASTSVEVFSVKQNQWKHLESLPSPRVDFTLQVLILRGSSSIT